MKKRLTKKQLTELRRSLEKLDKLEAAANAETAKMEKMDEELRDFMTKLSLRYYKELGEMDSASILQLGELINRAALDFVTDLHELEYKGNRRKEKADEEWART